MGTGKVIAPITSIEDPRYVKALAHPLRIRLLALLEERDASPVQLAEHVDATLGTVAYHVRTLERLGLIEMVATHQRRGATEHVYAARERPRISDEAWSAIPVAGQVMIASRISQIGRYVTQSAAAGGFDPDDARVTRAALRLDRDGWAEMAEATRTWREQAREIERRTERRVMKTGEHVFDAGLVVLFFEAAPFSDASAADDGQPRVQRRRGQARTGAPSTVD